MFGCKAMRDEMVPFSNLGAGERNVLILCLVVREMGSSYLMFDD